jgi:FKBP-type peptidyl-prolyl cis-trans isomerase SlyD
MQIRPGTAVTITYTLKDQSGKVLDARVDGKSLTYLQGAGNVVPGLENALQGKAEGERLDVALSPEEAYGPRDEKLVGKIPMRQLQVEDKSKVAAGGRYRAWMADGFRVVRVTAIEGDQVLIDGNHPMAGMALHFAVEVLAVREATPQELAHGHVHGPGDHHH